MKAWFSAIVVYVIYTALRLTWRVTLIEPPEMKAALKNKKPFVMAHWHGDEIALMQLLGPYRVATIVSTSKDGEIMNHLIRLFGARASRGSSTRGAVGALKGLIRLIREGHPCSFAVDGPKGPLHKAKPGVFEISRSLQLPIFVAGCACDRAFEFPKSWNKTYLPKPFARVHLEWHGPRPPIPENQDPRDPKIATQLEVELHAAKQQALASIAKAATPG